MSIGIYCIENKTNGKKYIGRGNTIEKRYAKHKLRLKRGTHTNKHLQDAWNKYGEENFEFYILEECQAEYLNEREIYFISFYKSLDSDFVYNKTAGGNGSNGFKHTEEAKEKIRKVQSVRKKHPMQGKKHSAETKLKMKKGKKSHTKTYEQKIKSRIKHKNKSSKYFGVRLKKDRQWWYWHAATTVNGKFKHISYHKEEIEAAKAYNQFVIDNGLNDYPLNDI